MDLAKYLLLQKDIDHLQLRPGAAMFLRERGYDTIEQVLDADLYDFPTHIGDQISEATLRLGLREPPAPPEKGEAQTPEDAWFKACDSGRQLDAKGAVHVACFETGAVSWSTLWLAPWLSRVRRLHVEAWRPDMSTYIDDFGPWLQAAGAHLPALRDLELGGYGERSRDASVGTLGPALEAMPLLRSLLIVGKGEAVKPFRHRHLVSLDVSFSVLDHEGAVAFIRGSRLPKLEYLNLRIEPAKPGALTAAVLGHAGLRACRVVRISGSIRAGFFAQVASVTPGLALEELDLSRAWLAPEVYDELAKMLPALPGRYRVRLPGLLDATEQDEALLERSVRVIVGEGDRL